MIAYLTGTVLEREENALVVFGGNVGYRVFVPLRTIEEAQIDHEIVLYTHHDTREGFNQLYGFEQKTDLQVFELLLTVSRIGPKSAMDILGRADGETILSAVQSGDVERFRAATKTGEKTAKRILQELESKVGSLATGGAGNTKSHLVEALVGLGYRETEALDVLQYVDSSLPEDEQVKQALQHFGKAA